MCAAADDSVNALVHKLSLVLQLFLQLVFFVVLELLARSLFVFVLLARLDLCKSLLLLSNLILWLVAHKNERAQNEPMVCLIPLLIPFVILSCKDAKRHKRQTNTLVIQRASE